MNQRIRLLAEQAGMNIVDDKFSSYGKFAEKFAELIVRECMEQLNISNVPAPISAGLNLGRVAIKEHFGVEESQGWVCPKCGTDRTKAVCPQGPSATLDGRCPMIASAQ